MDHPQYYQPLSHALNPVPSNNRSPQYQSYNSHATSASGASHAAHAANGTAADDDEEEEEEDVVEEELAGTARRNTDASNPASPQIQTRQTGQSSGGTTAQASTGQQLQQQAQAQAQPAEPPKPVPDPSTYAKRRPGRPKGSKTKKPQQQLETQVPPTYSSYYAYQTPVHTPLHPTGTGTAPPLHPSVNEHNQQYYEFQWRVLNLCAEFYGAAEELVSKTPALVLAQCYGLGTTSPVDPLAILTEAKRNCDLLLANPSALLTHPPPPMYPIMPMYASFPQPPPAASPTAPPTSASAAPSQTPTTATSANPGISASTAANNSVITNPQSFVLSLSGAQSRYPTAPYYQYTGPYQPAPQATYYTTSTTGSASATIANPSLSAGAGGGPATGGNSGTWSDEETERLKRLAEQSKTTGGSGEIEWDWVINQWGNSRTRHQILIKATNLGLKESSGRGVKRRRETDSGAGGTASPAPAATTSSQDASTAAPSGPPASSTSTFQVSAQPAPSASPAASTPASTQPSPALHHPQPPSSHTQPSPALHHPQPPAPTSTPTTHNLPWPMPTVASTNSPVITATEPSRQAYYRPRPNQSPSISTAKPSSTTGTSVSHQYMYQPNGGQRK
ncbi:hypothetical protein NEOLEDRAFT_1141558 [Neolentinus lepideus HHB14362 ss-1]|uniref:Myb-like domain-containing protein n=1 Tax=Neolentinus lepideus HHB14362 ss-1 TaxID=1314782 RepID=A0A165NL88_9AGAM|nr:hypothetical protein NEOLEDRAFT_1141558 [Neolentinus lepideus HHB14362 ss-1]